MAAYAALVSLMNTLNNIKAHPRVSTFFEHKQIQLLHEIIHFLLDFVESINPHIGVINRKEELLVSRIASTAHAAEDAIESHVVDQIRAGCCSLLHLETEIDDMSSLRETVMEFERSTNFKDEQSTFAPSVRPLTTTKKDIMVGFDEKLIQIMDKLTGPQPDLQVIPIVGMGGIGKTTLAKSVYQSLLIGESFDIRAWVTISQEYSVKNVLSELVVSCIEDKKTTRAVDLEMEDHQLGLMLYQTLWGRRYLIVLDDIWSLEAWDKIKCFFPNNDDKSRVVITTRIWSVATHLSSSCFEVNFLDEDQSWKLFCGYVFPDKDCPPELEEIGKAIVRKCNGLPLSIVVTGGLLRNTNCRREYWENFARDVNSILMSEDDEHCSNILSLSYNHLPAHLKPCFLYMGTNREDVSIRATELINHFVVEGFLKPKEGQTLEEVAEDCLNDLVDRNLIFVYRWRWSGRIKYFKMHDLVREVCLKIGEREKIFPWKMENDELAGIDMHGQIVCDGRILPEKYIKGDVFESLEDVFRLLKLRFHNTYSIRATFHSNLASSVCLLWNVHTLIFTGSHKPIEAPAEIWYMRQLRNVQSYKAILDDPPQSDEAVLPNLQRLSRLVNFSFTEEVCKRIPNIKKLGILYTDVEYDHNKCYYYLNHLHQLQSLNCSFEVQKRGEFGQSLALPSLLRKLSLHNSHLHWDELNAIGLSLPHLEFLKLNWNAVIGPEWGCMEGAFPCLKGLHIKYVDLMKWTADGCDSFPVLEKLRLDHLEELESIPPGMGDIQTLGSLVVHCCSLATAVSSVEILEEQLSLGNEDIKLVLTLRNEKEKSLLERQVEMNSFTTKNFEFDIDLISSLWNINQFKHMY